MTIVRAALAAIVLLALTTTPTFAASGAYRWDGLICQWADVSPTRYEVDCSGYRKSNGKYVSFWCAGDSRTGDIWFCGSH